jgi:hypothetical protein
MAAPNLKSSSTLTSVIGKTAVYNCTNTLAAVLSNGAASGKVLKINVIRASNIDTATGINLDVSLYRGTTHTYLCFGVTVPFKSTLIVLSKEDFLYLEEGDAIYAQSSTTAKIDLTITYEDIS